MARPGWCEGAVGGRLCFFVPPSVSDTTTDWLPNSKARNCLHQRGSPANLHGRMRKRSSVAGETSEIMHTSFQSSSSVIRASARFECDVSSEAPKPSFRNKTLDFRELYRPFETTPETTLESKSTISRLPRAPSRQTRLRRLIKLSSSKRLVCFDLENVYENNVAQFT